MSGSKVTTDATAVVVCVSPNTSDAVMQEEIARIEAMRVTSPWLPKFILVRALSATVVRAAVTLEDVA